MFAFKSWRHNNNFDKESFATSKWYYLSSNCVLWHMRSLLTSSCICNNFLNSHSASSNWFQIEVQYSSSWLMYIVKLGSIGTIATIMSSTGSPSTSKFPSSLSRLRPFCSKPK
jgi:hypothetical protein